MNIVEVLKSDELLKLIEYSLDKSEDIFDYCGIRRFYKDDLNILFFPCNIKGYEVQISYIEETVLTNTIGLFYSEGTIDYYKDSIDKTNKKYYSFEFILDKLREVCL